MQIYDLFRNYAIYLHYNSYLFFFKTYCHDKHIFPTKQACQEVQVAIDKGRRYGGRATFHRLGLAQRVAKHVAKLRASYDGVARSGAHERLAHTATDSPRR